MTHDAPFAQMPIPSGHRVHARYPGGELIGTFDGRAGDLIHLGPGKPGVTIGHPAWINLRTVYTLTDLGPEEESDA